MELTKDTCQRIVAAKMYMDDNFQEPVSLDSISERAFFSRFHFHRLFCRVYRKTPHQYLTRKRCIATYEELKAKGVEFKSEPKEQHYGIECIMSDGCGNWFSMTQPKAH